MLGKLMKYEFKATGRIFLPLFAALLAMSAVTRLMFTLQLQAPRVISLVLSIILMVAAFVITLILTIQRFYKNFLTNEGYLMFTLPVSVGNLISAKLLVAVIWTVVCAFAAYLSVSIMAFSGGEWEIIVEAVRMLGLPSGDLTMFIIELAAMMLMTLATGILTIYASMALSMLFNKHRVSFSFVFYIALSTVIQIVTSKIISLFDLHISGTFDSVEAFFTTETIATIHSGSAISLVTAAVVGAGLFTLTHYMLKNKLNLQ